MAGSIDSVSARDFSWPDLPTDDPDLRDRAAQQVDAETYGVCRNPTSVIGGALCGDDTAISTACRRAKPGTVDAYLCDDRNLEKLQDGALEIAKKAAKKAIELFFGAKASK